MNLAVKTMVQLERSWYVYTEKATDEHMTSTDEAAE